MDPELEQQLKGLGPLIENLGRLLQSDMPQTFETLTDLRDMFNHCADTVQNVRDVTYFPSQI